MKTYLRYAVYFIVVLISKLKGIYYRILNYRKKRVLIYTDSRGFEITRMKNRKNAFSSAYAEYLIKNYRTDFYICPEKHTTTIDFFEVMKNRKNDYDYIVLHTGIVEFSPRPLSSAKTMYKDKKSFIYDYFSEESIINHLNNHTYSDTYEGEKTLSFYNIEMAKKYVIPRLQKFENLIWISCNPILKEWQGNYFKDRPVNMNEVNKFNNLFINSIDHVIDISDWSKKEIKTYTCDNIHLTTDGFEYIKDLLTQFVK